MLQGACASVQACAVRETLHHHHQGLSSQWLQRVAELEEPRGDFDLQAQARRLRNDLLGHAELLFCARYEEDSGTWPCGHREGIVL